MDPQDLVIEGDALEELKKIEDSSIDLILTDPPYNISNQCVIGFSTRKDMTHDFGEWDHGMITPDMWIPECCRVLKDTGVFISFYAKERMFQIMGILDEQGFTLRHIGTWCKTNPPPQARKVKWMNGTEHFIIATKNSGTGHHFNIDIPQSPDWFKSGKCGGSERLDHPTQKPLDLGLWIVRYWSFPGDVVLDPFAGTGTFGIAALELGRMAIMIENDPQYCAMIHKRLESVRPGQILAMDRVNAHDFF